MLARSADEATSAAEKMGYPVVLKIESAQITHKSDVGGVALRLSNAAELRDAYARIQAEVRKCAPSATIDGVVVQRMAGEGVEMILGIKRDPLFGPVVLCGFGGILVEVLKDVAVGIPPLSRDQAHDMLKRLRGFAILGGVRGKPPADVDGAVRRHRRSFPTRRRARRSVAWTGYQPDDRSAQRPRRGRSRRGRGDAMTNLALFAHRVSRKFIVSIPSFAKGGLGRIWLSDDVKSPSIPLFQRGMIEHPFTRSTKTAISIAIAIFLSLALSPLLSAQSKPLKEIRVPYALGGSTSFFWVAQRSGSFEKYGVKVLPIFMRGGREAVQALISRDVLMLQQGSSGVILAWAQGAKDLVVLGATGNKLDYVFVSSANIKKPADLKGKRVAISQLGASTDFIARLAVRQLGLNEKDVTLLSIGAQGERWAALAGGHVDASVFQPPITLRARKAGLPVWVDFSKSDYEYVVAGPVTLRSFIKSDRETVMNFMRGLADGMDFYRDEKNKDAVHKYLGEFYRSTNTEELEETRRVYTQVTPGLPVVTLKAMENMIASDRLLSTMNINGADVMDLSFLKQLEEERKFKK